MCRTSCLLVDLNVSWDEVSAKMLCFVVGVASDWGESSDKHFPHEVFESFNNAEHFLVCDRTVELSLGEFLGERCHNSLFFIDDSAKLATTCVDVDVKDFIWVRADKKCLLCDCNFNFLSEGLHEFWCGNDLSSLDAQQGCQKVQAKLRRSSFIAP